MLTGRSHYSRFVFAVLVLLIGLNACSPQVATRPVVQVETPIPQSTSTPAPPTAEVTFTVSLLQTPPGNQKIYVDLLDEVTGLAFHPDRHELTITRDRRHYTAKVSVAVGSVIKYRYTREGKPAPVEYNCIGRQVRYRLFQVGGTDTVPDVICAWNDQPVETAHGRIAGTVLDASSRQPIPDLLISAAGASTLTASDGSYLLENLPPGTHNLIAYSLDGHYQLYQQGALVAPDATTPAPLELKPAKMVTVEFKVRAPETGVPNLPIRMIGNLLSLGNTFADLSGGISTVAYRAPLLQPQADGTYTIKLQLPAGLDLRYKYTLGDGFWNGELDPAGGFFTRQLIVPERDSRVQDNVASWQAPKSAPITFTVKAPDNTPDLDTISIQFNPFGWTEPLPMWPQGDNTWQYILYNPQNILPGAQYRYCRNEQCGIADDAATPGQKAAGAKFKPASTPQTFKNEIKSWAGWTAQDAQPPEKPEITRSGPFLTGVEIQPNYTPSWLPHFENAFESIQDMNASWVVLSPSWQYTSINPPVLEAVPGQTMLYADSEKLISQAREKQLHVAIYPRITGPTTSAALWQAARLDNDWWQRWFERYRAYIIHFADLAQKSGAEALILDGESVRPAFPGTAEYNNLPTNLPGDADARWQALITEIRARFHGQLLWAARYNNRLAALPEFIDSFDQIYLIWTAPLSARANATEKEMLKTVVTLLRRDILPLKKQVNKPIIIAATYPSVYGAVTGCLKIVETCQPFDAFNQPFTPGKQFKADFSGQAAIYRAILKGIGREEFAWVSGFISRGYYPAAAVQDLSLSIHGKPAEQTLTDWFAAFRDHP